MAQRSKTDVRAALAAREASRETRKDRLGRAEAPLYVGGLAAGAAVFAAKVVAIYNHAGDVYTDLATDGYVAFLKCNPWSIKSQEAGTRDLWIICREHEWIGILSAANDIALGVEAEDIIAYIPSRLPIEVPGQQPPVYFDGVLEPMATSHLSDIGETGGERFWALLVEVAEGDPSKFWFASVGNHGSLSGWAWEINGHTGAGVGDVVNLFPHPDSTGANMKWAFAYEGEDTELISSDDTIHIEEDPAGTWDLTLSITSTDNSVTITPPAANDAGHWNLSVNFPAPPVVTEYGAGQGIKFTVIGAITSISVSLAEDPGLYFVEELFSDRLSVLLKPENGLAKDATGIYVVANTAEGIHVDADGVGVSLAAEDSSLGFDSSGAVTHNVGVANQGFLIDNYTGDNILVVGPDNGGPVPLCDVNGHYSPGEFSNTIKHGPPGTTLKYIVLFHTTGAGTHFHFSNDGTDPSSGTAWANIEMDFDVNGHLQNVTSGS
jgi:hypothetical protein